MQFNIPDPQGLSTRKQNKGGAILQIPSPFIVETGYLVIREISSYIMYITQSIPKQILCHG
jgi:hypothetical protein